MTDPRIHLAIDNCFASKRWTRPAEWMGLVADMGVTCVEASADNECDPLYSTAGFLRDWADEIRAASRQTGVRLCNCYSGHGTYATLGLAHTDRRVRDHILDDWLKPMAKTAADLDAGLGFFCHAFAEEVLQDPARFSAAREDLVERLAQVAVFAAELGTRTAGVEQMYTPHHVPWTVAGARALLRDIHARGKAPFYITLDVGHSSGQRRFLRPSVDTIRERLRDARAGRDGRGLWLGPRKAYDLFGRAVPLTGAGESDALARMDEIMQSYPYLFAAPEDGDAYHWIRELGCYSPIIHLQQTDGTFSHHRPFTDEWNRNGIVRPADVLRALKHAYGQKPAAGLPPPCADIYLTIEVFSRTADIPGDLLSDVRESVRYWRRAVPEDGKRLSEWVNGTRTIRQGV